MQAVASRASAQRVAIARKAPAGRVAAVNVVCKASPVQTAVQRATAAAIAFPALLAANPAYALVDERLNGDGVGLSLGINDTKVGLAILGVFSLVWIAWFNSQKDLGDDSGRSL